MVENMCLDISYLVHGAGTKKCFFHMIINEAAWCYFTFKAGSKP